MLSWLLPAAVVAVTAVPTIAASTTTATVTLRRRHPCVHLLGIRPPLAFNGGVPLLGPPARRASQPDASARSLRHLLAGAARPPDDQLDRHRQRGECAIRMLDLLDQRAAGGEAQAHAVLANGRERRIDERCELDVVEADEGDVLGHAQASAADRLERAD